MLTVGVMTCKKCGSFLEVIEVDMQNQIETRKCKNCGKITFERW